MPVRISAAYPFSRHNYKPCCIVFIVLYAALKHLKELRRQIEDLQELLHAYRHGFLTEGNKRNPPKL